MRIFQGHWGRLGGFWPLAWLTMVRALLCLGSPPAALPPCDAPPLLQKAVAIVKSWPLFPDMCSISTVALQKRRPELLSADAKLPELAAAGNCPKLLTAGEAAPTASA